METAVVLKSKSSFGLITVPRTCEVGGRNLDAPYQDARIRNATTGKRDSVVLFDPQNEVNDHLLSSDFPIEMRLDLKRALESFTHNQQLIIVRVLLQGYTFQQATKRMRISYVSAWRWFRNTAIPQLQAALIDYKAELHEVLYSGSPLPEEAPKRELHTVKCKFCSHTTNSNASSKIALDKLKKHIKEDHPEQFAAVKKYVHQKDYEIRSFEMSMWETGKEISNED